MLNVRITKILVLIGLTLFASSCSLNSGSPAEQRAEANREAREAMEHLFAHTPGARQLAAGAKGILIFPNITKAGFMVGGQYGTGVLFKNGSVAGHYRTTSASYGLQAGIQKYSYAMFFMSDEDINFLNKSEGWEVGVGPTLTVVDAGFAKSITTTTSRKGVYVFFFEQKGLMAGLGIQGTKITQMDARS